MLTFASTVRLRRSLPGSWARGWVGATPDFDSIRAWLAFLRRGLGPSSVDAFRDRQEEEEVVPWEWEWERVFSVSLGRLGRGEGWGEESGCW